MSELTNRLIKFELIVNFFFSVVLGFIKNTEMNRKRYCIINFIIADCNCSSFTSLLKKIVFSTPNIENGILKIKKVKKKNNRIFKKILFLKL